MTRTIIFALLFGIGYYLFSSWRTRRMLDRQSNRLRDDRLDHLLGKLARPLGLKQIPVHVYEVEMINGLAAPDGRIFLTRGFIDKYKLGEISAEEIVSVIAHEMGHVALGHSRKRMIDFISGNALRTVLAIFIGRYIPFVGIYIANFISQIIGARLSRNDEYEADAYAAALLTKAGFGTRPQITMFEKLTAMSNGAGSGIPAWMMSHPKTEERIAAIEALRDGWAVEN